MASRHRSRSRSPAMNGRSFSRERVKKRHRDEKEKSPTALPYGAQPLTDKDYFLKNTELRAWLKEDRGKFFDELSGEKARSYFHKFVKAWNSGKLPNSYYAGNVGVSQRASEQTAYRWSFVEKRTRTEKETLDATRVAVDAATRSKNPTEIRDSTDVHATPQASRAGARVVGPTLPSASDQVLMREAQDEARAAERSYERKRERNEDKERIEDLVGPKERGREGVLEKKKMRREADRAARDAKDDTLGDYDDSTLMGGGDSFQARIAQRDAARRRFEEKRAAGREEKGSAIREKQETIRAKDKATMEMFKQMAKEKFGG